MPPAGSNRSRDRRRWTLAFAYAALLASCDSPFAPDVLEVARLDVTPPVLTMVVGGEQTLVARAYDESNNILPNAKVFWSTQDPTVVVVSQGGVVTAIADGTAQIAASSGGASRTIAVSVSPRPIALVRITPPAANVVRGQTFSLLGEAIDGTGTVMPGRLLEWTTSDPTVATVDAAGVVTGVALGEATISASGEGKTGTSVVTVVPAPVATISVTPDGGSLPAGGTLELSATPRDATGNALTGRTLQWRSSNDAVATVSASGLLTAISPGTVSITVSAPGAGPNGTTPSTSVTVTVLIEPVASAVIVPSPIGMQVLQTATLTLNLFGGNGAPLSLAGRTIEWASDNAAIATVDATGVVTGVAVGTATVTATITTPGQLAPVQASTQVNVSNRPVASVVILPGAATVHAGFSRQFAATALDATKQPLPGRVVIFTSSNQAIATVDASSGLVTGLVPGSVQIRGTSEGIQGAAAVTVDLVGVSSVSMTPGSATLLPAQTQQVTAVPRDSATNIIQGIALGGRTTQWSSSNPAAATVSTTGLVTAVAPGTTEISATVGGTVGRTTITVNALPSATQLAIITQPSATALNDAAFAVQPAVQLKDANGNNVLTAGIPVTAAITPPGSGTLGGTVTALTNAAGLATFSNLKITGLIGSRTITFSSGTLTPATSSGVNVLPGAATQLVLVTPPPASANSGQVFSSATVLQLRDVSGNDVTSNGVLVSASVSPSAGVTLSGASTTTTAGTATFGALTLTGPAGNYTLTFTSGALSPVSTGTVTLGAGSGSKLSITTQPSSTAQNGQVFPQQPVIQLLDGSNNPVAQAGVSVSAAILSGGGNLGGTTVATTGPTGQATFTNLSITGTAGTRTLLFGASGFTAVTSNAINITPGAATALSMVTQPSATAQSGVAFASQPAVRLVDASGNAVAQAGVTVTATLVGAGGSLIGSTTATTSAAGLATFSGLGIAGTVGSYSLAFNASGVTSTSSTGITISAGAASQLTISTQPAGAASGSPFTTQPAIRVRDAQGNPVLQAGTVVTAAIASGSGSLSGTATATTDATGLAVFSGLGISGTVGAYTLGFSAPSLTGVTSNSITLTHGIAAQLAIVTQPNGTAVGAPFTTQPVVQIRDAQGNPVTTAGAAVSASIASGPAGATLIGSGSATTDATGTATFSGLGVSGNAGAYTIGFSSGSLNATSVVINLVAGAPAQLTITTQPSNTVQTGGTLAQQPSVQVRDGGGNAVLQAGINVVATLVPAGASLTGTTTVATNSAGLATFTNLGATGLVGSYSISFGSGALSPATSAAISVTAGPATQLSVTTQPGGASSGAALTSQPAIQLRDAQGNAVNAGGVTVSVAVGSGPGASLTGSTSATTNASGLATFSGVILSGPVGSYTLAFSSTGLTGVSSGAFALGPGAPALLSIQTQPGGAVNGASFTTQPAVLVRDAAGNAVGAGVSVGASIASGPGGSLVGSTSASTASNGVATFSGLGLSGPAGNYTLNFSATGAPSVSSGTLALAAGAATQLTMASQPPATNANGATLSSTPSVQLLDAGGNAVGVSGVTVTVALVGSGASLGGTLSANTAGGVASFPGLTISGSVGSYTLSFTSPGLTGVTSSAISLTAGAPTQLSMVTQPPSTTTGSLSPAPAVQLRDGSGNAVPLSNVLISASPSAGGALSGTTTVGTDGSGIATFTGMTLSGPDGSYTITFGGAGLTSATSSSINLVAPATQLAVTSQPSPNANSGVAFAAQPSVELRNTGGTLVSQSGVTVTVSLTGGGGTLTGTTSMNTTNGVATFTDLGITGLVATYALSFSSTGLTGATSSSISLAAGAPTQLAFVTAPPATAQDNVPFTATPAVRLRDAQGNNVLTSGVTISASVASGPGGTPIGTTSIATDASGTATFNGLGITGPQGTYTMDFASTGLTSVTSGGIDVQPFAMLPAEVVEQSTGSADSRGVLQHVGATSPVTLFSSQSLSRNYNGTRTVVVNTPWRRENLHETGDRFNPWPRAGGLDWWL